MKYMSTLSSRIALLRMTALTVVLCASPSFANPFDDGTEHTVTNNTDYGSVLYVGSENPNNTLIVTNNSKVHALEVIIGEFEDSTNNLMSITGDSLLMAGNSDTNGLTTGGIVVGNTDGDNAISVNNASKLEGEYLYIGFGTNDSGKIKLAGEGTELNIAQDAYVGYVGSTNSVDIGSGSAMNIGGLLTVGSANASNNHVTVFGTLFVNSTNDIQVVEQEEKDNGITVKNGGTLQVGGDVATETLAGLGVDMQNRSTLELGGELTLKDNQLDSGHSVILNNDLSTNNAATWSVGSGTFAHIGETTSYNTLTLTNGATGSSSIGLRIGTKTSANNNALSIGGEGTKFIAEKSVLVGGAGSNNKLNITDGGEMQVFEVLALGKDASSTGNEANVGSNAVLSVGSGIVVGANGGSSTFTIDHGRVSVTNNFILGSSSIKNRYFQTGGTNTVAGEFIIGQTEDATGVTTIGDADTTGNLGSVGEGATLNIHQNLIVGKEGGGSILLINDGGTVNVSNDVVIGEASDDNYIFLEPDDPDSRFNVMGDLVVGKEGGNNRFAIYGGTADIKGNLYLGGSTNQHVNKNYIHLETTNAVLNVANAIYIGASNSINTLDLVDGATVSAKDLFVGTYDGVSNNVVTVRGADSLLSVSNNLTIGSNSGSNNAVNLDNGGILFVGGDITIGSSTNDLNNLLNVNSGGTLHTIDWDFATVSSNIVLNSGSTLMLNGELSGTNMIEGEMGFTLNGAGASWDTTTNIMYVGYETANNALTITNGARATTATNLYIGFASDNNTVTIGGAGSVLDIENDLFIGNVETNDSYDNSLFVTDNGLVTIGKNLMNSQRGTLKIGAGSQVWVGGNYEQTYIEDFDIASRLEVGVSSNAAPPNLKVEGIANFEEKTTIAVYDDGVYANTNVVQVIVMAGELTIGDQEATTGLLDKLDIETNTLLDFDITVSNNMIIVDNFILLDIGDVLGLEGQLLDVANELYGMATNGNELAQAWKKTIEDLSPEEGAQAMDNYYGKKASSGPMHNVVNQGIGSIASELTVRSDNTRDRATAPVPSGAPGPHTWSQELQGWIAGYGTLGSKSEADGFDGYDSSLGGFIIGADLAVSQNILVGLAGGSNSGSVDKDNNSSGDTKTTYGAVYASAGTKDWFMDGSVIYGTSSIDNTLGDVFDTTASYDARNLAFYLGGGKEILGEYLIITPQASILANYYEQDAYDEKSTDTVARSVDGFDALYVQSSLGCNLGFYSAMGETTIRPELRAHWLHEFNANEEDLAYTLIGGTGNYNMILQAPVADLLRLGAGVSAKLSEFLELRADLDTRLSADYSDYTVFGSLRYQF